MRRLIHGAGLAIALLLSIVVSASAQSVQTSPDSGKYVGARNKALAVTTCYQGQPIINFRPDVPMDSVLAAEIYVHESVHVRQLTGDSLGTCEQKLAIITGTPEALLASEAEAYCAQIVYARGVDKDDLPMFQWVVRALAKYFDGYFRVGDVSHALNKFCTIRSVTLMVSGR